MSREEENAHMSGGSIFKAPLHSCSQPPSSETGRHPPTPTPRVMKLQLRGGSEATCSKAHS